jgi:hypothetical protein
MRKLLVPACAAALVATATDARAQAPAESATEAQGFGERASTIFSVESVFGYLTQSYDPNNGGGGLSFTHSGFFPTGFMGTRIGLHHVLPSGVTLGGLFGFAYESGTGPDSSDLTAFNLGPRVGYAGALPKAKMLGYWARVGPSFQLIHVGNSRSSNSTDIWALDLSLEAFFVWTPVEHFGVLAGPSFDIGIAGNASSGNTSEGFKYASSGINAGLVFDF